MKEIKYNRVGEYEFSVLKGEKGFPNFFSSDV